MDASAGEPSEPAADASVQAATGEEGLPPRFSMEMEWWVASIRESISAEDLRGIRLRRSTIEAATARLGGGRQGTVQLLKLILVWVRQNHHHLQRKRPRVVKEEVAPAGQQLSSCPPGARANPGPGYEFPAAGAQDMLPAAGGGTSLMPSYPQPLTPPAYGGEVAAVCPSAAGQCPFHLQSSSKSSVVVNSEPFSPGFGGQYGAARAASHPTMAAPQRMAGVEASATNNEAPKKQKVPSSLEAKPAPAVARHVDIPQRLAASDKRQLGTKANEKDLRFLLQRELKQSDIHLGRIVLPKMEAKVHLPEVKTKYGISIPMEDMGTSRVWKMRYYMSWPKNRSKIYMLGNTGAFVRSNGLQEGDFIVIYSDVKSGKYLVWGVKKVRPSDTTTDSALRAHFVRDISEVDFDEVDLDTKICDLVQSARKSSEVDFDKADLDTKICDLDASARKSSEVDFDEVGLDTKICDLVESARKSSEVDFDKADLDTKICDLDASARKSSEVDFDEADLNRKICDLVASARKSQSSSKKKELTSRDGGNFKSKRVSL